MKLEQLRRSRRGAPRTKQLAVAAPADNLAAAGAPTGASLVRGAVGHPLRGNESGNPGVGNATDGRAHQRSHDEHAQNPRLEAEEKLFLGSEHAQMCRMPITYHSFM